MYVDLNRLTDDMWVQALPQLTSAQGQLFSTFEGTRLASTTFHT